MYEYVRAPARLAAVEAAGLLDAESEEAFDRLAALARQLLRAPFAFLTVVDDRRSFWMACLGIAEGGPRQNALEESFCQYVVETREPLVLPDVRVDERTRDNPSIVSMGVVAWAGYPVHDPDGHVLGTLCVVDTVVRHWTDDEVQILASLAAIATREVALRAAATTAAEAARMAEEATAQAEQDRARAELLACIGELLVAGLDLDAIWQAVVHLAVPTLGQYAFIYSIPGDGSITPQAVLHGDPAEQERLEEYVRVRERRVGETHGPGRVAATGRTEVLTDLTTSTTGLIAAQQDGVRALRAVHSVTVPLRARNQLIAVLSVVRVAGSPAYEDGDVELIEAIADRAALAIDNALAYDQERTLSLRLQQSLLPGLLPRPPHLHVASRYQPAASAQLVGGDWYDAYIDAHGTTAVVIGDVAGHDIDAAAAMGQLRTMLRMAGHGGGQPPSGVLATVDAATRTLGVSVFATALLAQVAPFDASRPDGSRRVAWASAGHPPPVLVSADGVVTLLDSRPGRALGLDLDAPDDDRPRTDHQLDLAPGDTLLLYTDGLVERRDEDLDTGLSRLRDTVTALRRLPLEALCDAVLAWMTPDGRDDIALIAVRATDDDGA
ncbi:GAF domain-containing SpoIIE family protein phosphatase [Blastococcus capsensis]|uniref:GAF domain-containing SpoIIE family protein phosphatase n=1 Tax=Blastococcus capsensis TaxID=1564163 RepID=UPI00254183C9|nr:GAF domain-containing SpoIIE family protein phosphatase [Blastococcus capsensis]MDK3256254.1 SpoIIE family protein phosphatase [Blastococcus capsensis]